MVSRAETFKEWKANQKPKRWTKNSLWKRVWELRQENRRVYASLRAIYEKHPELRPDDYAMTEQFSKMMNITVQSATAWLRPMVHMSEIGRFIPWYPEGKPFDYMRDTYTRRGKESPRRFAVTLPMEQTNAG